jgi:hypothetical protein
MEDLNKLLVALLLIFIVFSVFRTCNLPMKITNNENFTVGQDMQLQVGSFTVSPKTPAVGGPYIINYTIPTDKIKLTDNSYVKLSVIDTASTPGSYSTTIRDISSNTISANVVKSDTSGQNITITTPFIVQYLIINTPTS